ncbi:hypothetical protein Bbelb_238750 [Branchiostoma belcheri]|nr:hypothetical protein Bbelb_238750 [Branchiostoma belcheri]
MALEFRLYHYCFGGVFRKDDEDQSYGKNTAMTDLVSVEYEIYGENTRKQARRLNLVGWVQNTRQGTVAGVVQGPRNAIDQMKHWLRHVGSPMSRIEGASFDEKSIARLEFGNFDISYGGRRH